MIQLFQAEWCPYSAAVRQKLAELDLDFVARQVAPYPEDRDALRDETGIDTIPVLVLEDGTVVGGDTGEILAALDQRFPASERSEGHREQAVAHGRA